MTPQPSAPTLPAALDRLLSALADDEATSDRDEQVATSAALHDAARQVRQALQARPVEGWTWTGGAAVGTPDPLQPTVGSTVRHIESGREAEVLAARTTVVVQHPNFPAWKVEWPDGLYEVVSPPVV